MLHQEERRTDIDREETIEILDCGVLDGRGLRDASIGDENIEAAADDAADFAGQIVGAVWRREIGLDRVDAATTASASFAPVL